MNTNRVRVLLIEDSLADARLIREMLAEVGSPEFELSHATRLSEGLQQLNAWKADVVLLDLGLPDSFGLETLTKARQGTPETPIIVLTNLDDRDTAVQAITQGANDYMVKGKVDSYLLARAILRQVRPAADHEDGAAD